MLSIDPKTVVFFSSILSGLMTLILLAFRMDFGRHIRGMLSWAVGTGLFSIACILYSFRGIWPMLIAGVLGNALFIITACCWTAGTLSFYGRQPRIRVLALICVLMTCHIWWFMEVRPDYQMRLVVFTAVVGGLYAVQAVTAIAYGESSLMNRFFSFSLVIASTIMLGRAACGVFAIESDADFFSTSSLQIVYLIVASAIPLVLSTGFFMVASRKVQNQYAELSRRDFLTSILNRRAFFEQCEIEHARHARSGRGMSIILIDIDHFKLVNDTHGHVTGDNVLIGVCRTVQNILRKSDAFGRLGGEEFAVLLPETNLPQAHGLAERIRTEVEQTPIAENLRVTLSLGVTMFMPQKEVLQDVIRRADSALYQAKSDGRNRTVLSQLNPAA